MINKFVTWVCKLFKRNGSVYPGFIIYDVLRQKKVLESIKYPKYVIAITGSSGKGSTTQVLYNILSNNGFDVCYNQNGSLRTTAFIMDAASVVRIRESSSLIGLRMRMACLSTASSGSFNISKSDGEKKE